MKRIVGSDIELDDLDKDELWSWKPELFKIHNKPMIKNLTEKPNV